jgi:hypothetical protein
VKRIDIPTLVLNGTGALLLCIAAVLCMAPRNSAGTFTLDPSNPVVPSTTISDVWANNTLNDIAIELTGSLSRNNKGNMLAQLGLYDGTVNLPGLAFGSESGSGLYRIGSNDFGFSVNQVKKLELTSSLFTVVSALGVGGVADATPQAEILAAGSQWGGTNTGQNLIIKGARNNGIGIFDSGGTNPLAIYNAAGALTFSTMPALTDTVTNPTVQATISSSGLKIGASGTAIPSMKKTTVTWDPGATGAGGCAVGQTASVTNIALGDICWAAAGVSPGAAWTTCEVTSAGTVTVNICAFTNTDIVNSTWTIWTLQAAN